MKFLFPASSWTCCKMFSSIFPSLWDGSDEVHLCYEAMTDFQWTLDRQSCCSQGEGKNFRFCFVPAEVAGSEIHPCGSRNGSAISLASLGFGVVQRAAWEWTGLNKSWLRRFRVFISSVHVSDLSHVLRTRTGGKSEISSGVNFWQSRTFHNQGTVFWKSNHC